MSVDATITAVLGSVSNNEWRRAVNAANPTQYPAQSSDPIILVDFTIPSGAARWEVTLTRNVTGALPVVLITDGTTDRRLRLTIPTYEDPTATSSIKRVPFTSSDCTVTVNALDADSNVMATASTTVGG